MNNNAIGVFDSGLGGLTCVKELNKLLNIPEHLDVLQEKDVATIAQRANKEGNPLYPVPRVMDTDELAAIIRKVGNLN